MSEIPRRLEFTLNDAERAMFRKQNEKGVKYIFSAEPGRKDVLDIENFADFVQKRDDLLTKTMEQYGLRLPEKMENFGDYFKELNSHEYRR